jgi:hypothetical protein
MLAKLALFFHAYAGRTHNLPSLSGSAFRKRRRDYLDRCWLFLYIVHMKNVKASEARKRWFQLLDDALRGEVIAIERNGQRIMLRREEPTQSKSAKVSEQYKKVLKVRRVDEADQWSWEWRGPGRRLASRRRSRR